MTISTLTLETEVRNGKLVLPTGFIPRGFAGKAVVRLVPVRAPKAATTKRLPAKFWKDYDEAITASKAGKLKTYSTLSAAGDAEFKLR